jgi:hypothetical protein
MELLDRIWFQQQQFLANLLPELRPVFRLLAPANTCNRSCSKPEKFQILVPAYSTWQPALLFGQALRDLGDLRN